MKHLITIISIVLVFGSLSFAQENFADAVGSVSVGDVQLTTPLRIPFILWGGDIPTFYANGGLRTKPGTIFAKLGLDIELVPGDDFHQQVRDCMAGKSAFVRGVFGMPGQASEVLGSDPRTKPTMFLQMTWSAGDHCVARAEIKTIEDMRGKKWCLQAGGPHDVGFIDDILATGNLTREDVTIVWADDLTGTPNSPAEMFRKDPSIAACFVVTPDMIGLTGGLQNIGSGAEGTVKGARVLVSTSELSYSITDVYCVRKDFWDKHSDTVTKFAAGYLKACEEVIELKKTYERAGSKKYMELLQLAQDIYGKDVVPTLEEDVHGLLSDCTFVGHRGNREFFENPNNPHGFDVFQKKILDIVVSRGYVKIRQAIAPSPIDWNSSAFDFLTRKDVVRGERFKAEAVLEEIEALSAGGALDERTIVSFSINFQPNQITFSEEQYGVEYERVVETITKFGNAVIAVIGYSDPTKVLLETVRAGIAKKILQVSGAKGNYSYSLKGRPLNLSSTQQIIALIESGEFDGVPEHNPREIIQAANNLSRKRAEAVVKSIVSYAKNKHNLVLDQTQIQPVGVGIRDPFIAKPNNLTEAKQNMRVVFRLIRVTAEAMTESDFDF